MRVTLQRIARCLAVTAGLLFTLAACTEDAGPQDRSEVESTSAVEIPRNPTRQAFFGDLHVHTSWSTDAYSGRNRVGPDGAYRFARGEAVELPSGIVTQLHAPLDFVALTDHAEGFDAIAACTYPEHPQYDSEMCENMRAPTRNQADYLRAAFARGTARPAQRNPDLCADVARCLENARSTWRRVQAVANEFDQPGKFTTLIGYEFSSLLPQFGMLHRNVIFRGTEVVPHAISSLDVNGQADFFAQLDAACQKPCEVLTIPHNTNYSWGLMFARTDEDGSEYTPEDLERRARLDRLAEVTQQKGTSECQVGVAAADEDCDFGLLFPVCEAGQTHRCVKPGSFVRNALLDGIQLASEGVRNPFKLGMIGSTDTHQSDPGNTNPREPSRYAAVLGDADGVLQALQATHPVVGLLRRTSEGGLAGIWAESNTRGDLFDALRRREAFATSGTRMKIRFFAGDLPADLGESENAVELAYANGVPMGADLIGHQDPKFWVWAMQDPTAPTLDRIQVIKGWIEDGQKRHRVWDIACAGGEPDATGKCPPSSASVDAQTCQTLDTSGASELEASFNDATYVPSQRAFYYVRVLENPSCRWTTWLANSAGVPPPEDVPFTVQNRGWSSPIWLRPN